MTDDGRRWVPEGGLQKLKNKIHRESKAADDFKKLPFTFSKPIRKSHAVFVCVIGTFGRWLLIGKNVFLDFCQS